MSDSTIDSFPDSVQPTVKSVGRKPRTNESQRTSSTVWQGFRWAFFGNVIYSACHWGLFIVLARLGSPELVGQFAVALAICGPVLFVSNLQLRAIQASDASWQHSFAAYWSLRMMMAPVAFVVIAGLTLLGNFSLTVSIVILVMGLAKVIESFSDICYGAIQRDNRLDLVGKSLAMKGPASLLLLGILIWLTQSVAIGVIGIAAVWLMLLIGFDFANVRQELSAKVAEGLSVAPRSDWTQQKELIAVGLPMGISMGLLALTVGLPSILIERFKGEHELGIYAALASLTWAGLPLINAMGQTVMPQLGQLYVNRDAQRLRLLVLCLGTIGALFGATGVVVVWLAGEWVVAPIYGAVYARHTNVLIWLMGAASILYAVRFLADALTAMRCVRVHLVVQAMAAIIVLVGGLLVVPEHGMVGMAQVIMLAFALRGVILLACFWWKTDQLQGESKNFTIFAGAGKYY